MHYRILPYKMGSRSSKAMRDALSILQVHPDPSRSKYRAARSWFSRRAGRTLRRRPTTVINWGSSTVPEHLSENVHWINHPDNVSLSSNKLFTLSKLTEAGVPCPEFTTDREVAQSWCDAGEVVIVRKLLSAHSGRGIVVCEGGEHVPSAPLYTKYIKKSHEYRYHALPDGSHFITQKRRSRSVADEDVDWRIRNHQNGFIFAAELSHRPNDIEELCERAKEVLGLDFCAFDVLYNEHQDKSYIIESNCAIGLAGRTVELYVNSIKNKLNL